MRFARNGRLSSAVIASLLGGGCTSLHSPSLVVPFEFVKNQIILETYVDGTGPYAMLLDTAVDPSVIDENVARAVGASVATGRGGEGQGAGTEHVIVHAASIPALRVGGVAFGNLKALASNMSRLSSRLGRPLHGVLGYSFLKDKVVTIDYPARLVDVNAEDRRPRGAPPSRRVEFPLEFVPNDTIPLIRNFEADGVVIPVSLDTGSSFVLDLYAPAVAHLHLEVPADAGTRNITGARGDAVVRRVKLTRVGVVPLMLSDQEVSISDRRDVGAGREGNLGNGFFQHYVLTIDYRSRRVVLQDP